jgi:hypothetical protein
MNGARINPVCHVAERILPAVAVVPAVRARAALVWPYRKLMISVLALDAFAVAVTGVLYRVVGLHGAADERGLFAVFAAGQLATAGLLGVAAFMLSRRHAALPHPAGSFLWGTAGIGLIMLAADDFFTVHERAGAWLLDRLDRTPAFVNSPDDLVTLFYGVAGIAVLAIFRQELLAFRASSTLLVPGAVMAVVMLAIDALGDGPVAVLENPAHAFAGGLLLLAQIMRLHEVLSFQPPAPTPENIRSPGSTTATRVGHISGSDWRQRHDHQSW